MRILLIHPRDASYRHRGPLRRRRSVAPLTLTTLAALVPRELQAEVRLVDEGVERPDYEGTAPEVVGISCLTPSAPRAYELARRFRERGSLVVLGGVHPTLNPREAAEHADTVVAGCAEQSWPDLLRAAGAGKRPAERILPPGPRSAYLPPPRRDLLRRGAYLPVPTLVASRGCRHGCTFCCVPPAAGREAASRPVGEVVEEIRALGARRLIFLDSNFAGDREYAVSLLEALIPLEVRWFAAVTADAAEDGELQELFARSGCFGLFIGLESLAQESLAGCGKRFHDASRYLAVLHRLHELGIAVICSFAFGLEGDDAGIFARTLAFLDRARPEMVSFGVLTPFPGTPLFAQLRQEGRILTEDWGLYDTQHVVFQPARMACAELQQGLHETWLRSASPRRLAARLGRPGLRGPLGILATLGSWRYARRAAADAGRTVRHLSPGRPAPASG